MRLAAGARLLAGTIFALVLGLSGVEPQALESVGIFWAIYGFMVGLIGGVLEPVVDGVARLLANAGLQRARGRLIDRHPADPAVRRLRRALEELKEERFGSVG